MVEIIVRIGQVSVFLLIVLVIFTSIKKHGQPKVTHYNLQETLSFNLLLIIIYTISGILYKFSPYLIILAAFHIIDIALSIKNNGVHKFSVHNGYKSSFIMICYFFTLYLVGFWDTALII